MGTRRGAKDRGAVLHQLTNKARTRWCSRTRSTAATSSTPTRRRCSSRRRPATRRRRSPTFSTRLDERNKDQAERNGLFASHPETKERIDKIRQAAGAKPGAGRRGALQAEHQRTPPCRSPRSRPSRGRRRRADRIVEGRPRRTTRTRKPKIRRKKGFGVGSLTQTVAPGETDGAGVGVGRVARTRRRSRGQRRQQPGDGEGRGSDRRRGRRVQAGAGLSLTNVSGKPDVRSRAEGGPLTSILITADSLQEPTHPRDEGVPRVSGAAPSIARLARWRSSSARLVSTAAATRSTIAASASTTRLKASRADLNQLAVGDRRDRRAARVPGQERHLPKNAPSPQRRRTPSVCDSVTDASPRATTNIESPASPSATITSPAA